MADLALPDLLQEEFLALVLPGGVLEGGQLHQFAVERDVEPRRALTPLLKVHGVFKDCHNGSTDLDSVSTSN